MSYIKHKKDVITIVKEIKERKKLEYQKELRSKHSYLVNKGMLRSEANKVKYRSWDYIKSLNIKHEGDRFSKFKDEVFKKLVGEFK